MSEEISRSAKIHSNVKSLGWVSFFNDFASEMIYPLLPVFLVSVLGVGPAVLGIIEGLAESSSSLLKLFSGWISDRLGRRKSLIVAGYTLSNICRPLIGISSSWTQVLFLRFSDRAGKGIRTSPRDAMIAEVSDSRIWGRAFGFQRSMDHLGAVAGPVAASILLLTVVSDVKTIFLLSFLPGLMAILIVAFAVKEKKRKTTAKAPPFFSHWKELPRNFKFYLVVIGIFTLGNSTDAFLLMRAQEMGVQIALLPILWLVLHLVKVGFSLPGGALSDRIGRRTTIACGWAIYFLVYLGFAFFQSAEAAWILFAVYGLYFGLTEGTERALVADLVPSQMAGVAYGLYHFIMGIALLPASVIFGLIWRGHGSGLAFAFGSAMALMGTALLFFLRQSGSQREDHP